MNAPNQAGLARGIRRWDLVALTINSIIGAGIFGLPSRVYALTGTYSLLTFGLCALVTTLILLCFAEVGARFERTGGPYLYAREAFGPTVGFEIGWLMWLARLTAFAALCNLMVGYADVLWPGAGAGPARAGIIATVVVLLATINILGVRDAALVSDVFTIGKLLPLVLFVAAGLFFIRPERLAFTSAPGYGDFSKAVLLLVFAFTGFEIPTIPAGEARDPRRDLPFGMLSAMAVVAVLYILIQLVCVGTLPGLAHSERPLADASRRFLGTAGATVLSVGALISIGGTLHAIMLASPRLPFAMAEQGQLPRLLGRIHPRFHTPHVAILLSAGVAGVLALSGSFIGALTISTLIRLITYGATCASLPVLRRRAGNGSGGFRVPGGVTVAAAAFLMCVWLLSSSTRREARDVAVAAGAGLIIHVAIRMSRRRGHPSH